MMNDKSSNSGELLRIGSIFKGQQIGKRPEAFHRYISGIVNKMEKPITFKDLLYQLELAAVLRHEQGEKASPLEKVDHLWQIITYHDPKRGRVQKTFKTLRNHLSKIKKHLFPASPI